jgi:hypothetical protein
LGYKKMPRVELRVRQQGLMYPCGIPHQFANHFPCPCLTLSPHTPLLPGNSCVNERVEFGKVIKRDLQKGEKETYKGATQTDKLRTYMCVPEIQQRQCAR